MGSEIALVVALLVSFALFGVAALAACLRWGPRRGTWNQPAAALRAPGRRTSLGLYVTAALHVVSGVVIALAVPGAGLGILVLLVVVAMFYVLFAHSFTIANRLVAGRIGAGRSSHSA